jgi:hypothetical protein
MTVEQVFSLCNTAALISWVALIAAPHWALLTGAIRWGVITGLSVLYAVLIAVFFFRVQGGGFFSLAAVQILFTDRHVALAGWVHYLAFDLFVGLWIAARADALGINRLVQAPILVATFMFGPLGFLLFQVVLAAHALGQAGRPTPLSALP